MTETRLRTCMLFPDQLKHMSLPRPWSPGMELHRSGGLWIVVHSLYMHITAMPLQRSQKKRK